jgi:hypothetical protein
MIASVLNSILAYIPFTVECEKRTKPSPELAITGKACNNWLILTMIGKRALK